MYNFIEYYQVHYSSITDNGPSLYVTVYVVNIVAHRYRINWKILFFDSSYGISKFKFPRHLFSERQFVFFILDIFGSCHSSRRRCRRGAGALIHLVSGPATWASRVLSVGTSFAIPSTISKMPFDRFIFKMR
jgi:hypothetical protein